jgi:hypothetical protein
MRVLRALRLHPDQVGKTPRRPRSWANSSPLRPL